MMKEIVSVQRISHRYTKDWAVSDVSFNIEKTGVTGLLGSNGAGKSTAMNIICGVVRQSLGKVLIDGIDTLKHPQEAKRKLGFLPQNAPLYLDLTVDEYLRYCGHIRQIPPMLIRSSVVKVKERCGVAHFSKRLIRNLSGGYRQRVGIAQAIIHEPALVVLDEPTNGLDPNQIAEVRKLIVEIAADRAVIFSSHILAEVQATCKYIKMIEGGRLVFSDSLDAFNNYSRPQSVMLRFEKKPSPDMMLEIAGVMNAESLDENRLRVYGDVHSINGGIIKAAAANDWSLLEITIDKGSLEEVFAQLSGATQLGKI